MDMQLWSTANSFKLPQFSPIQHYNGPVQREPGHNPRMDIASVRANVNQYMKRFNARYQEYPAKRIRNGVMATFFRVCDAYIRQNPYLAKLTGAPVPVRLNNPLLASQLGISTRTVINHLAKLERYGFLQKTFRGTNADYEITVDPRSLLNDPLGGKFVAWAGAGGPAPHFPKAKIFPYISTRPPVEIWNIGAKTVLIGDGTEKISGVVAPNTQANPSPLPYKPILDTLSCNQPEAPQSVVESQALSTVPEKKIKGAAPRRKIPGWQKAFVLDFFAYMMQMLYPFRTYSGDLKREILNKIYFDVYGAFQTKWDRKGWEQYQANLMERIRLAKDWLERPLPPDKAHLYKEGKFLVNPLTYLDAKTPYGFIKTHDWLVLTKKRRELVKAEWELQKAMKEILSDGDMLAIYRKWQTRFKNKRLPEAMVMFESAMASILQQLEIAKNNPPN